MSIKSHENWLAEKSYGNKINSSLSVLV